MSQSGWASPINHFLTHEIQPGSLVETGGHRLSAQAISQGQVDFAALDALSWNMIKQYDPFANDLVEITRTEPTPALPFITGTEQDAAAILAAIETAIGELPDATRQILGIRAIVSLKPAEYLVIPTPLGPNLMARQGMTQSERTGP